MVWVNTASGAMEQYNKTSDIRSFWDTWDKARDHLINRAQDKKAYLLRQVERLEDEIETLIAMKKDQQCKN